MVWTCPHGRTYSGSEEFISGAKNAHLTCAQRERTSIRSAITGRFVKLATAVRHPRETVRERRRG